MTSLGENNSLLQIFEHQRTIDHNYRRVEPSLNPVTGPKNLTMSFKA